jgi:hypothetical protein
MNADTEANNVPQATKDLAQRAVYNDQVRDLDYSIRLFLQQIADLLTFANLLNAIKQSEAYSATEPAAESRADVLTRALYFVIVRAVNIGAANVRGKVEYGASLHHKSLIGKGAYDNTFALITPTNTGDLLKTTLQKQGRSYMYVGHVDAAKQSTADVDRSEVTPKPEALESNAEGLQKVLDRLDLVGAEIATVRDLKLSLPTPTPLLFDREAAGLTTEDELDTVLRLGTEEQARALLVSHKVHLDPYLLDMNLKPIDVNTLATQAVTGDVDHVALSKILGSTFQGQEEDDDTTELERSPEAESTYVEAVSKLVLNVGLWSHGRGWWSDLKTGEYLGCNYPAGERPKGSKAVGDQIALIHTEVSEAYEGYRKDKPDEHCPEFMSLEVELADALIRIADMAYGLKLRLPQAVAAKMTYNHSREDHSKKARQQEGGKKL